MNYINGKLEYFDTKYKDKRLYLFIKQFIIQITDHAIGDSGAMLTYYFILSFFPFLIFLISLLSYTPLSSASVFEGIIQSLPVEVTGIVRTVLEELINSRSEALLSTSIIFATYSASRGLSGLIRSINKAYDTDDDRNIISRTILALIFTVFLAVLFVVMLLSLVFGKVIINELFVLLKIESYFMNFYHTLRLIIPIVAMIIIFVLLYMFAPNEKIKFMSTLPGALFATIGGIVTSAGFAFYVNNFARYNITYGSLGGVVILLVWVNLLSCVIVLGAEINGAILKVNANKVTNEIPKIYVRRKKEPVLKVREAALTDSLEMSTVYTQSWKAAYSGILSDDYLDALNNEKWTEELVDKFESNSIKAWVVSSGKEIIACATVADSKYTKYEGYLEVESLYVLPKYWENKAGSLLMDEILSYAKKEGYEHLNLWDFEDNAESIKFYEKFGFKANGDLKAVAKGDMFITHRCFVREI